MENKEDSEFFLGSLEQEYDKMWTATLKVNGQPTTFKLDTGAAVSVGGTRYAADPLCRRPAMPPTHYATDPLCRRPAMPPTPIMCVVASTSTRGDQHRSCLYDV